MRGRARIRQPGARPGIVLEAGRGHTGIDKRPASGRVRFDHHVDGDFIGDTAHHGGPDQAVYAYAREDAAWWADLLGRDVPLGAFGENLSTSGLDVTGAVIGERWAVGSAVLEVSGPRIPCRTFVGFWEVRHLIRWFRGPASSAGYLRIAVEGDVGAGDRSLAARLLDAPELPAEAHEQARIWLAGTRT